MNNPMDTPIESLVKLYKLSEEVHSMIVMTKVAGISKGLMVPEELEQMTVKQESISDLTSEMLFSMLGIKPEEQKKRDKLFKIMESIEDTEVIVKEFIKALTNREEEDSEEPESIE